MEEKSWFSWDKALQQHREAGTPNYKIKHCIAVAELGRQIAQQVADAGYPVDETVVVAACLLHDIGISVTKDDVSPIHAAIGANMIRELGYPELVARCVEAHEFAGIEDAEEAVDFGIEDMGRSSWAIETWEEKCAVWADYVIFIAAECMKDLWADPLTVAKAHYPYLRTTLEQWSGKEASPDHPCLQRVTNLQREMMPFTDRSFLENASESIAAMHEAMRVEGVKLPFPYEEDLVLDISE